MARILLIEPDFQLAETISQYLNTRGHKTSVCGTAQRAISQTDHNRPDIIILELQLPIHNGIEFLYELRSYTDWQNLPVIVHSQISPDLKAISPMLWHKLKITDYLYKPFTKLTKLNQVVDNVLVAAK